MSVTVADMARAIEHTLLRPEATPQQVDVLCDEALRYGFAGVCVNPIYVRRAAERLTLTQVRSSKIEDRNGMRQTFSGCPSRSVFELRTSNFELRRSPIVVATVGFPLGVSLTDTKADEARRAINDGAREIDMVVALGALTAGD